MEITVIFLIIVLYEVRMHYVCTIRYLLKRNAIPFMTYPIKHATISARFCR